jgi:hypothetical protein
MRILGLSLKLEEQGGRRAVEERERDVAGAAGTHGGDG